MALLKDKRIFIVEDDAGNLAVAAALLRQHGAQVSFDRWGVNTTHFLTTFRPVDVILLDLMFPRGVSGYDVYADIRRLEGFDAVPVVIVSAADAGTEMPKARRMGFAGFIGKPIQFLLFPQQIAAVCAGEQVWFVP